MKPTSEAARCSASLVSSSINGRRVIGGRSSTWVRKAARPDILRTVEPCNPFFGRNLHAVRSEMRSEPKLLWTVRSSRCCRPFGIPRVLVSPGKCTKLYREVTLRSVWVASCGFVGSYDTFASLICTFRPTALAYLRSVVSEGMRPLSMRGTADWEVPMRRATCAWVSFAFARACHGPRMRATQETFVLFLKIAPDFNWVPRIRGG